MLASQFDLLGRSVIDMLEGLGRFTRFCVWTMRWGLIATGKWNRVRLLAPQLFQVGTRSVPVVMIVGAFIGMVLVIETYDQFAALGLQERLGGIVGTSVVRQIGPVLAAVMIAGRVGGAVSAELGTMRVTEQLDAMRVMGADPISYLVVPRVIACVIMVPALTIFSNLLGIWGGYLVTVKGYGVDSVAYWSFSSQFVENYDLASGLIKSVVFGLAIGLISCYKGFNCRSGAAGVGRATTDSFVTSFIVIIVSNFFLATILKNVYVLLYGVSDVSLAG